MAQDSQNTECLFDFLYIDRDRINSYCAQLFDDGVLTSVKKIARHDNTKNAELTAQAVVAKLTAEGHETTSSGQERQFEAGWSNVISVIAELNGKGFLSDDLEKSSVGSLVLLQGRIAVVDIGLAQQLYTPAIQAHFVDVKITHANKAQVEKDKKTMAVLGGVLKALPPVVQMYLETANGNLIWTTINPSFLTINTNDIGLKYGSRVDGEWRVMGLIDAKPSNKSDRAVHVQNEFLSGLNQVIEDIRTHVGRPGNAWGMTPVAIYRTIKPA